MAEKKPAKKAARTPAGKAPAKKAKAPGFTAEERLAMKEHAAELKAAARGEDATRAVLAKIAAMPAPDRAMAGRLHEIVTSAAPSLEPRLWYGMPAYSKDGKVLCYFQAASKFKARYATFGFSDAAALDDGAMWPTSFALTELSPAAEAKIGKLVKQAAR